MQIRTQFTQTIHQPDLFILTMIWWELKFPLISISFEIRLTSKRQSQKWLATDQESSTSQVWWECWPALGHEQMKIIRRNCSRSEKETVFIRQKETNEFRVNCLWFGHPSNRVGQKSSEEKESLSGWVGGGMIRFMSIRTRWKKHQINLIASSSSYYNINGPLTGKHDPLDSLACWETAYHCDDVQLM